ITSSVHLSPCIRQSQYAPRSGYGVRFPQTSTIRLPVNLGGGFMKLVLKIAAGVFLGIFVAFCVYIGIDSWESHERSNAYAEQQKQEFDAQKKRIDRAAQDLFGITDNEVLKRCGPPLRSDDTSH